MNSVIRRHRLPHPYRVCLTILWMVPLAMFIGVIVIERGVNPALLDPRFVIPALLMTVPAVYFWQEGIDVLPDGLYRRIHLPRYVPFTAMARWQYQQRVLIIWDEADEKLVECRAGHLTDFSALVEVLEERFGTEG